MSDYRSLIFSNLLNGVPVSQVCRDFQKSESEVMQVFHFVFRKRKSYCFLRSTQKIAMPMVYGYTIEDAKKSRLTCLNVLPKLNLNKEAEFKDIQAEIVTPDNAMQVTRNIL